MPGLTGMPGRLPDTEEELDEIREQNRKDLEELKMAVAKHEVDSKITQLAELHDTQRKERLSKGSVEDGTYELQTDEKKLERKPSGAVRESKTGKGAYHLIPPESLHRLAVVYEKGAVAHGDRNWEKGLSVAETLCSAIRHCFKYLAGSRDEDHLAQACWNLFSIMWFEKHRPKMQDIPARMNSPRQEI